MCRWIAYRGAPTYLETFVAAPAHSLIHQSLHAAEAVTGTNGDGFGVGWYADRDEPGLYRETLPAWSDENLRHLCRQIRARLFFAHVRASTGPATSRANCHPFAYGRWLFMHNGQIGGWPQMRRTVEGMIPDALYAARMGGTDSEALFLAAIAAGAENDPVRAVTATLETVARKMRAKGVTEPLRFAAALTDGRDLYAFRWSSDDRPPTLYWSESEDRLLVASEPLDGSRERWALVPPDHALVAPAGAAPRVQPMTLRENRAA
ncbi:class II glutamine amidotransferase [Methylopila sp. 73B]|uniref:class II glutamine amidotransferase n=1 Tax=Methylopila sp. 73B TaxID=1120792 RepID=UPI00036976EB|nr:class II glutamine amidotransferase [Methylopila sp. 73B]